ncbi:hypothetical protein Tco_1281713, partial [Tanacetum coccineum]
VGDEKLVFNVESTSKYPHKHGDESINQIDIIDTIFEDYFHEVLNVQKSIHPLCGSPTHSSDLVVTSLSLSLTPFGDSDFLLEETNTFIALDLIPPGIDNEIFDAEGDILLLEKLLNIDSTKDLPPLELNNDSEGDILSLEKLLEDEPSEAKKLEIDPLIREPSDSFLMGDMKIKFNPLKDIGDPVSIPRVSEKPLDFLDLISKTFNMTITNPLFEFDITFTLNLDNQIFDFQNKDIDKSEMETLMDEVQIASS